MNRNYWTKAAATIAVAASLVACSSTEAPRQATITGETGKVVAQVRDASDTDTSPEPADDNKNAGDPKGSPAEQSLPAPLIYFKDDEPFSVTETDVVVITEGEGDVVAENATVSVHYHGVNAADGDVFDSTYEHNQGQTFSLNRVIPGFRKAIAGQKVGSEILVAVAPQDGYGPSGGTSTIGKDDTIVFVIHILDAS